MPRFTRSQRRDNPILEDEPQVENTSTDSIEAHAPEVFAPSSPVPSRAPLGVIDVNDEAAAIIAIGEMVKAGEAKKSKPKGGKKTKGGRKAKKEQPIELVVKTGDAPEVVEDDDCVAASPASQEACRELLSGSEGKAPKKLAKPDAGRPRTPPSRAVRATRKKLSRPGTPHFNPEIHEPHVDDAKATAGTETEDSFVEKIESRSPAKLVMRSDENDKVQDMVVDGEQTPCGDGREDSFVDKIIMKTPAKTITRIEDSVDAIDALEDAIEQVGEAIVEKTHTPKKAVKAAKPEGKHVAKKPVVGNTKPSVTPTEPKTTRTSPRKQNAVKPTEPKTIKTDAPKKTTAEKPKAPVTKPATKPLYEKPGKQQVAPNITKTENEPSVAATKRTVSTKLASSEAPATKKRPVSISFPPPPAPIRSTKPLTRPTFELPGEAISRKLKEQREERLKRAEQEEQQKREFKAKPVRVSMAPVVVKGTAASRARESLMHGDTATASQTTAHASNGRRCSSSLNLTDSKRNSTIGSLDKLPVSKRPMSYIANTSATRLSSASMARKPSSTASTVTPADAAQLRARGREVFERDNREKQEREKARQEKEAAAKKARQEAAERGRMASREWAEKQKLKLKAGAGASAPHANGTAVTAGPAAVTA